MTETKRSLKGLLLEMKMSKDYESKILAEETVVEMFSSLETKLQEKDKDFQFSCKERDRLFADLNSYRIKLQKAVEALKSDCFCEYNESVRPVTLVTQCIYCKTIKELES